MKINFTLKVARLFKKTFLFLLFGSSALFSQKYELGKVTVDELIQKSHATDTAAVAAVLFKKGDVRFEFSGDKGFSKITRVMYKIKIYKKEGFEWGNFMLPYFSESSANEDVNFSEAATYNLVDGKVEKTKLKSNGEFTEKLNKYWSMKKIVLPNVKEGSIIEFRYEIKSPRLSVIEKFDFQTSIPVNYAEFKTAIPEYYTYNPYQKGFVFPKVVSDAKPKKIEYSYTKDFQPGGVNTNTSTNRVNSVLEFTEHTNLYTISNVPALRDESFVNNINNYTSSISHELAVIVQPDRSRKTLSTDWESVTKTIYENDFFGPELNKTGYFDDDLKSVLTGLNGRDEIIAAVFAFVKNKIKWNNYYDFYCDEGVRSAYKKGSGNVAEINLMLTAMLRYAGVDANPVLISTRSNGIASSPNRTAYNYVICAVEIENDLLLLDATSKYTLPNILPIRDLNWVGRMIRKNGTSAEVDLMPKMLSKDIVNVIATLAPDGNIEGKIRQQLFDYNALVYRSNYIGLANEAQIERIEKRFKGIELDNYTLSNQADITQPIVENYSFKSNNIAETIGDKMYFSPMLFFAMNENPFKQETREYPVDFSFPFQDKFQITLTIPDNYAVETLPASVAIPMSDNNGSLKYAIANNGRQIQLSVMMDVNSAIISAEYYEELKAFFSEVVKKENEKIVLKKI